MNRGDGPSRDMMREDGKVEAIEVDSEKSHKRRRFDDKSYSEYLQGQAPGRSEQKIPSPISLQYEGLSQMLQHQQDPCQNFSSLSSNSQQPATIPGPPGQGLPGQPYPSTGILPILPPAGVSFASSYGATDPRLTYQQQTHSHTHRHPVPTDPCQNFSSLSSNSQQPATIPGPPGQGLPGQPYPSTGILPILPPAGVSFASSYGATDPRLTYQQQMHQQLTMGGLYTGAQVSALGSTGYCPNLTDAARPAHSGTILSATSESSYGATALSAAEHQQPEDPGNSSKPPPEIEAGQTGRTPIILYMSCDRDSLSEYQCLVRQQIELFEANRLDVDSNAQGRNRPIVLGQVGIRCRHCTLLPPRQRARGAVYYPAKLHGLYQAAQNMASGHLCGRCQHIPARIRQNLLQLRERKSSAGGGKKYWADCVRILGIYEDDGCLRFESR